MGDLTDFFLSYRCTSPTRHDTASYNFNEGALWVYRSSNLQTWVEVSEAFIHYTYILRPTQRRRRLKQTLTSIPSAPHRKPRTFAGGRPPPAHQRGPLRPQPRLIRQPRHQRQGRCRRGGRGGTWEGMWVGRGIRGGTESLAWLAPLDLNLHPNPDPVVPVLDE